MAAGSDLVRPVLTQKISLANFLSCGARLIDKIAGGSTSILPPFRRFGGGGAGPAVHTISSPNPPSHQRHFPPERQAQGPSASHRHDQLSSTTNKGKAVILCHLYQRLIFILPASNRQSYQYMERSQRGVPGARSSTHRLGVPKAALYSYFGKHSSLPS